MVLLQVALDGGSVAGFGFFGVVDIFLEVVIMTTNDFSRFSKEFGSIN